MANYRHILTGLDTLIIIQTRNLKNPTHTDHHMQNRGEPVQTFYRDLTEIGKISPRLTRSRRDCTDLAEIIAKNSP